MPTSVQRHLALRASSALPRTPARCRGETPAKSVPDATRDGAGGCWGARRRWSSPQAPADVACLGRGRGPRRRWSSTALERRARRRCSVVAHADMVLRRRSRGEPAAALVHPHAPRLFGAAVLGNESRRGSAYQRDRALTNLAPRRDRALGALAARAATPTPDRVLSSGHERLAAARRPAAALLPARPPAKPARWTSPGRARGRLLQGSPAAGAGTVGASAERLRGPRRKPSRSPTLVLDRGAPTRPSSHLHVGPTPDADRGLRHHRLRRRSRRPADAALRPEYAAAHASSRCFDQGADLPRLARASKMPAASRRRC
jgi:hypothetical protein